MAANDVANLQQLLSNLIRIQLLLTQSMPSPGQSQIDALVAAAANAQCIRPKPTTTVDGMTYNWTEYLTAVGVEIDNTLKRIQDVQDPFIIMSRWTP